MNAADIHRYSSRAAVDREVDAMRKRIVDELRAIRPDSKWGLLVQAADGREDYRARLGVMEAKQEAWDVTAEYYRREYMRIEHEVTARWGYDA